MYYTDISEAFNIVYHLLNEFAPHNHQTIATQEWVEPDDESKMIAIKNGNKIICISIYKDDINISEVIK